MCKIAPKTPTHRNAQQGREKGRAGSGQPIVPLCDCRCDSFALQRGSGFPIIPPRARRSSLILCGALRTIAGLGVVAFDAK